MTKRIVSVAISIALVVGGCAAQSAPEHEAPERETTSGDRERIEDALVSLESIVDHQDALGLDDAQREAMRAETQRAQQELVDLEWRLGRAREALARTLAPAPVDEEAAIAAAREVAAIEGEIEVVHMRMRVRLGNALRAPQREVLDRLR
ncbi:hypothetical protein [Sandaracinus amylolyticus]|uniref:hypothetical protein n=1 Tax=Sandaracinus amylolyticus TaxID=927083 RepID=UPI001F22979E|nr:hypothetical protein [Sandaracinus amylolyticus]UJR85701.1 Hypothetical protein I5071_77810 [Sandaracinus amylolyticus]